MSFRAVFKLGYFVLERVAEPLSRSVESVAARSPAFRRGCVWLANYFESSEAARRNRFLVGKHRQAVPVLTEEAAVAKGSELVGEGMLWGVGIAVVLHQHFKEEDTEAEDAAAVAEGEARAATDLRAVVAASEGRLLARLDALEARLNGGAEYVDAILKEDAEEHVEEAAAMTQPNPTPDLGAAASPGDAAPGGAAAAAAAAITASRDPPAAAAAWLRWSRW
jgi:hypothetical protein